MGAIDIVLTPDMGALGLDNLIEVPVAETDLTFPAVGSAERYIIDGVTGQSVNVLRRQLMANVLTTNNATAASRAIVYNAFLDAFKPILGGFFAFNTLDVEFNSRRKLIELDAKMSPYYGNVIQALDEIILTGTSQAVAQYILDTFNLDSGIYRSIAVCALVTCAAVNSTGSEVFV